MRLLTAFFMRYIEYLWYIVYVLLFSFLSNQNINTINWHTDNGNFSWWIAWLFVYYSTTTYPLFVDCNSNCPANQFIDRKWFIHTVHWSPLCCFIFGSTCIPHVPCIQYSLLHGAILIRDVLLKWAADDSQQTNYLQ